MSHPATSIRGVTFIQNAGTPQERVITQTSVPMLRRRLLPTSTQETVVREFNLSQEDMHAATLGSRSIPFGGPIVVLQAIAFQSGTDQFLAHRLKSAKAMLLLLAHPRIYASGSPLAWVVSVDDTIIRLRPLGNFTADVVLGLGP